MEVRRVVTGHTAGKSDFISDGRAPRSHDFSNAPGMSTALVWSTKVAPVVPHDGSDPMADNRPFLPRPGETALAIVTIPPDTVTASPEFNAAAAEQEYRQHLPGFIETFEPDNPGVHTTDTVDYAIVLDGEILLELDDGKQVHLKPHDTVIQNGTRHAWRNKSAKIAKIAFVLIGAKREI
jgi:hypothetical protein